MVCSVGDSDSPLAGAAPGVPNHLVFSVEAPYGRKVEPDGWPP